MRKYKLYLLILCLVVPGGCSWAQNAWPLAAWHHAGAESEFRGLWVDAWNTGVLRAEQIPVLVARAQRYGFNALVVQVRRRGDALYFPTAPNTEPRLVGLAANYDPLAEVIVQAHAAGLQVHAWITTFLIASAIPSQPQHVYHVHPEYLTRDHAGHCQINEGYYLDPGNPHALAWNRRVVLDLVEHYDIDGLHFDYIRYPAADSGFNPVAVARFNREFGLQGLPAYDDPRFVQWRQRQITDWLRQMYLEITMRKPQLVVSAATLADRQDAREHRFQDWSRWLAEGLIDVNMSMNYTTNLATYRQRAADVMAHAYGRHVYMGCGAYLLNPAAIVEQLEKARALRSQGLILFSYAHNNHAGQEPERVYQYLHQTVFASNATVMSMPWKRTPRQGHLRGVVRRSDGGVLENATISLATTASLSPQSFSSLQTSLTTHTDALGRFGILYLDPGTYRLVCSAAGCAPENKLVNIRAGQVSICKIQLEPGATTEIILDNERASFTGHWQLGYSAKDKYGVDYCFHGAGTGQAQACFQTHIAVGGWYRIYEWHPQGTNRTPQALYWIEHAAGCSRVVVNQQTQGGTWNLLGTWYWDAGSQAKVTITNQFSGPYVVIADALRLQKVP